MVNFSKVKQNNIFDINIGESQEDYAIDRADAIFGKRQWLRTLFYPHCEYFQTERINVLLG